MSLVALTIFALALILANGVAGYAYLGLKQRTIEKSTRERGAEMSDAEQETIQEYRSQQDKLMKATLLGSIGMLLCLILNLGNK